MKILIMQNKFKEIFLKSWFSVMLLKKSDYYFKNITYDLPNRVRQGERL